MLNIKLFRENQELIKNNLYKRGISEEIIDEVINLDRNKREILYKLDDLKHKKNTLSKEIGLLLSKKLDVANQKIEVNNISEEIKKLDDKVILIGDELYEKLIRLPNIADKSVPIGKNEDDNVVIREWGEKRSFQFNPKPHWELCEMNSFVDFERGAKLGGNKFIVFRGIGATVERKLINLMLDNALNLGYVELSPPYVAKSEILFGSGQLPKFEDDLYKIDKEDLYLIPTGEVAMVNLHSKEILSKAELPLRYACYTPCFRREAGAAGKEGRGLIRIHQFDKVELVHIEEPGNSNNALEEIVDNACSILEKLNLPYRVVLLCTGDMTTFSTSKTYDIEVWSPYLNKYLEISSCSNCTDFQARRAGIKYRDEKSEVNYVHTLNGSGLAVGRCFAAIIENYQNEDGSIELPEVLR